MSRLGKIPYQTKSAVLFVIFNRPETTKKVFEAIRIAQPKRLYIAADGPRPDHAGDVELCKQTREIVSAIDWECDVKSLFRNENAGCKHGVSAAITWFFDQEEEGIILEDDCLPANSFFKFCDVLLEKYRYDTRIRHITGCNLQFGNKWGNASYYFSNRTHVWGWASWKRVWDDYDLNLTKYNSSEVKEQLKNIYADDFVAEAWTNIFNELKAGKINSWAYPLDFCNFFNNGLVIIPNENLISNIGFDPGATNTIDEESIYANIPLIEIEEISDPDFFVPQKQADLSIINRDFNIEQKRLKYNAWHRKLKRWIKFRFK
ncbi:nucleotide-diphospho-sugar transferase [Mucilaginibacter sp.]|uniref:nucleotide-diphospho-sugar transferase n=1 Tax=Mucilaginibacter sp. TaxID=1882438 RepID=UPI00284C7147|nr:nucleotide-diphospho-sugar transferase [Mucilaginibacter sp.]MDR3693099.1 nucleotide-diphospho-sugar transferase [Mucilaginibacter sp.]